MQPPKYGTGLAPLTRRELLSYLWLVLSGLLTLGFVRLLIDYLLPRARAGAFGDVVAVGRLSDLPTPGSAPVAYPEGRFWLVHTERGVLALYSACTHLDCLCNWNAQQAHFVCPCHGSVFDRDGALLKGPAPRALDRFVVQIVGRNGDVWAETDRGSGAPLPVMEVLSADTTRFLYPEDAEVRVDTRSKLKGGA
ncbi:MAG: Rieske (2Fe-2S) protein [Anaerolineae bacterium]|nr:Rieske (2Fe-2S) protein [Anaerolineae bacterium]MDW8070564.1 Rieske (2Fe-2S) protein [Anaerolineae bacterium]